MYDTRAGTPKARPYDIINVAPENIVTAPETAGPRRRRGGKERGSNHLASANCPANYRPRRHSLGRLDGVGFSVIGLNWLRGLNQGLDDALGVDALILVLIAVGRVDQGGVNEEFRDGQAVLAALGPALGVAFALVPFAVTAGSSKGGSLHGQPL
ncbi:hypothetical protein PG984_002317 [Apiospora sp. TS-2023a]